MAGMIRDIVGILPSEVRAAELAENQKAIDAAVAKERTFGGAFGAGLGTSLAQSLGEGLMSRLGLETPEMAKAKANKEQGDMIVEAYRSAKTPEQMEDLIAGLMAIGAPLSVLNSLQSRADKLRSEQTPVTPDNVTDAQLKLYSDTMAKAAEELGGIDLTDLSTEDLQAYYRYVMGRVNQQKAKIETANKQGAKIDMPLTDDVIRGIIENDARVGILSSKDKFFGLLGQQAEFNMPRMKSFTMLDPQTGEVIEINRQGQ